MRIPYCVHFSVVNIQLSSGKVLSLCLLLHAGCLVQSGMTSHITEKWYSLFYIKIVYLNVYSPEGKDYGYGDCIDVS